MKNIHIILLLALGLAFVSCKKEEFLYHDYFQVDNNTPYQYDYTIQATIKDEGGNNSKVFRESGTLYSSKAGLHDFSTLYPDGTINLKLFVKNFNTGEEILLREETLPRKSSSKVRWNID